MVEYLKCNGGCGNVIPKDSICSCERCGSYSWTETRVIKCRQCGNIEAEGYPTSCEKCGSFNWEPCY